MIGVHRDAFRVEEDRPDGNLPLSGRQGSLGEGEPHRFLEGWIGHHRYTKGLGGIA